MIRPATPQDIPVILEFVAELAEYERAPHLAVATAEQLHAALFAEHPAVFCHIACTDSGEPAGMAIWFLNFSTWDGVHGIYLEDLYVRPAHRGTGLGRALLAELAAICVQRGYTRLQWWVLDWITPAIDFYKSIGAMAQDEWTVYRVSGQALATLAGSAPVA